MSRLLNFSSIATVTIATVVTAELVIIQPQRVMAKSATEIAAIALETTVKIDNTLGIAGGSGSYYC